MLLEVLLFVGIAVTCGIVSLIIAIQANSYEELPDVLYADMPDPYPELDLPLGIEEKEISN